MKCQFFPFVGVFFALAFAPGLTSVHAAGDTALDTATIETITGLKGVSNQAEGTFKVSKPGYGSLLRPRKSVGLSLGVKAAIDTQPLVANK